MDFPRRLRLVEKHEYQQVFKKGFRYSDAALLGIAVPNSAGTPRLGLAIAKKHVKSAVARNRIKRIIRESFRHHQARLLNLDIVILSRPGVATRNNVELRASLERHWIKLVERCVRS